MQDGMHPPDHQGRTAASCLAALTRHDQAGGTWQKRPFLIVLAEPLQTHECCECDDDSNGNDGDNSSEMDDKCCRCNDDSNGNDREKSREMDAGVYPAAVVMGQRFALCRLFLLLMILLLTTAVVLPA